MAGRDRRCGNTSFGRHFNQSLASRASAEIPRVVVRTAASDLLLGSAG
jgi:hypothetical protein